MPHFRATRTSGPGVRGSGGVTGARVFGRRLFTTGENAAEEPFATPVNRLAQVGGFEAAYAPRDVPPDIGALNKPDGYLVSSRGAVGPSLPLTVFLGQKVAVTAVRLTYKGPAMTMYLCWGLKAGWGNFNNGENLVGGSSRFASAAFSVPESMTATTYDVTLNPAAVYTVGTDVPTGRTYDTHKWIAMQPTSSEASFVRPSDTDSGVVVVQQSAPEVSGFDVAYALG
ncbi:MAG: hypothetical protein Q8R28_23250 [Dehalococcoidia bacterium]|nr:hypothetical protein [Dehalococcoidia bacterium]